MKITITPERVVEAREGESLLDVLIRNGLPVDNVCHGKGTCGKCKVHLQSAIPAPTFADQKHLTEREIASGVRLACQTGVQEDMTLELALKEAYDRKEAALRSLAQVEAQPGLTKVFLQISPPSLADERGDWDRLADRLAEVFPASPDREWKTGLGVLTGLGEILRANNFAVTVTLWKDQLLVVEPGDTSGQLYGVAVDIGTTSVGAALVDLKRGEIVKAVSCENGQTAYGADVISRIAYAGKGADERRRLKEKITETVNSLLNDLVETTGVKREHILKLAFVGNTTMHHLFLGLDTSKLAVSPYVAVRTQALELKAGELDLQVNPEAVILMFPNIGSFVGGDTVGAVIGAPEVLTPGNHLVIDLGTNCELFLKTPHTMLACSTAAGPAFEGAGITQGMRAKPGAIEGIEITGDKVVIRIIDEQPAVGICGSGLIEAIDQMRKFGVINKQGSIADPEQTPELASYLRERIRAGGKDGREFVLAYGEGNGADVVLNQKDIGELQLAKGAVCAGIKTIVGLAGILVEELDSVILAGTFATFLTAESILAIGLVPWINPAKIKAVGNSAHAGAIRALLSQVEYEKARQLAAQVKHIELGGNKTFTGHFIRSMYIAPTD